MWRTSHSSSPVEKVKQIENLIDFLTFILEELENEKNTAVFYKCRLLLALPTDLLEKFW